MPASGVTQMTTVSSAAYEDAFRAHRSFLWGLSYRLTGSAAGG